MEIECPKNAIEKNEKKFTYSKQQYQGSKEIVLKERKHKEAIITKFWKKTYKREDKMESKKIK